jgi:plasmid stability protein
MQVTTTTPRTKARKRSDVARRGRAGRAARPAVGKGRQLTVRNVPVEAVEGLRRRARREGKSLNAVLVDALTRDVIGPERVHGDLDALAGAWRRDPAFEEALAAQDRVDEAMWR